MLEFRKESLIPVLSTQKWATMGKLKISKFDSFTVLVYMLVLRRTPSSIARLC